MSGECSVHGSSDGVVTAFFGGAIVSADVTVEAKERMETRAIHEAETEAEDSMRMVNEGVTDEMMCKDRGPGTRD